MDQISINLEDIQDLEQNVKGIRGSCSTVYPYKNNTVLKLLNDSGKKLYNEEQFSNIVGLKNETCVFPKQAVFLEEQFVGYTMEQVHGEQLQNVIASLDFSVLERALQKVEADLHVLAKDKILFQDVNQGNLMWDAENQTIKIIDTDFFQKEEGIQEEECYNHNIGQFNNTLEMELKMLSGQGTKISEFLHSSPEFSKYYKTYMTGSITENPISIVELIQQARKVIEKEFGKEVTSLKEMQELIESRDIYRESNQNEKIEDTGIPTFQPPQGEINISNKMGIKQRIANMLAQNELLRKIPFVNDFVEKHQRLLLPGGEDKLMIPSPSKTPHQRFVDKLSNMSNYSAFDKPVRMSDPEKIREMKQKMDAKSREEEL